MTHPSLGALAALVGTWRGEGEGHYPTITPFRYGEEVVFAHDGRPVLAYRQRTWRLDTEAPLHAESGFLRGQMDGHAELVVAQPTGMVEVALLALGEEDGALVLDGDRAPVARTPSAKAVEDLRRRLHLAGDTLTYDLWMTYAGHDDEHHLHGVLHRS